MSADNGIYILHTKDGFRVVHSQAIDNIDYFPEGTLEYKAELVLYFGHSKVYATREKALLVAGNMEQEIMASDFPVLEYGISTIDLGDQEFPEMSRIEAEKILDDRWKERSTGPLL